MINKKGVYSLSLFTLLLILYIAVIGFSYFFYDSSKNDFNELVYEDENINSLNSFRNNLVKVISLEGNDILFNIDFDHNSLIKLNNTQIEILNYIENDLYSRRYSSFGVEFCNYIELVPSKGYTLNYNGSCITKN